MLLDYVSEEMMENRSWVIPPVCTICSIQSSREYLVCAYLAWTEKTQGQDSLGGLTPCFPPSSHAVI